MKAKDIKSKSKSFAMPGKPMTEQEFKDMIKAGEKGPFLTLEEFKKEVQSWISKSESSLIQGII